MKTKILLTFLLLMTIKLSANVIQVQLSQPLSGSNFNACSSDTVRVYKPIGSGLCEWFKPGLGYFVADSIDITISTQGN